MSRKKEEGKKEDNSQQSGQRNVARFFVYFATLDCPGVPCPDMNIANNRKN